jgi:hypothetical protein
VWFKLHQLSASVTLYGRVAERQVFEFISAAVLCRLLDEAALTRHRSCYSMRVRAKPAHVVATGVAVVVVWRVAWS